MLVAVQTAVRSALLGDADLMAVCEGVWDKVHEGAAMPYVVLGLDGTVTPDPTHGPRGRRIVLRFHVWSNYDGAAEALEVERLLQNVLDHQPLDPDGVDVVSVRHQLTIVLGDPDPDLRHVVAEYALVAFPEAP